MADGLVLDGTSEALDVFDCPHCGQTIDTSADVCRFCGAKIDHEAAEKATHLLAKVDQACSDASVLRYTAVTAFCVAIGLPINVAEMFMAACPSSPWTGWARQQGCWGRRASDRSRPGNR